MGAVRKRCVFYLSGFDPKGAAHYHALYRDEAKLQSAVSGQRIEVGPRKRQANGNFAWQVESSEDGFDVSTHYEFMRWDDVVRAHWQRNYWQVGLATMRTALYNLRHGTLTAMARLAWPAAVALWLPPALLTATALFAPLVTAFCAWVLMAWGAHSLVAGAGALAAGLSTLFAARRLEQAHSMTWLMRSFAFTMRQAQGRTPDLELRLDEQAAILAARIEAGGDDEILVVGHSSGSIMATSVVARALRLLGGAAPPSLSLLTLGQCIPMLALLPAHAFRRELAEVAGVDGLTWVDFSAPPDGSCFALCDPIAGCGIKVAAPKADRPKLLPPRFAEMFDAADYARLKKDRFRLHFQYIMASRKPVDYDYFRITAGHASLGHRFESKPSVTDYTALRAFNRRKTEAAARP